MENPRTALVRRDTKETQIQIELSLMGSAKEKFQREYLPDHMLILFSKHGFFDLSIKAEGDIQIDYHHLVEDMGISWAKPSGKHLRQVRNQEVRFFLLPMDETLVSVALDLSNRGFLVFRRILRHACTRFQYPTFQGILSGICQRSGLQSHIRLEHGTEPHHVAEAMFKGFAKALDLATQIEPRLDGTIPSTKEPCPLKRSVSSETSPKSE